MSPFIALPGDFYSRGRAGMFWFYLKNEIKMELNGIIFPSGAALA